jgi:hypothetical protein
MISLCVDEVSAAGYKETAALLSIALLDLRVRLSGLSESEISAVTSLAGVRREVAAEPAKLA